MATFRHRIIGHGRQAVHILPALEREAPAVAQLQAGVGFVVLTLEGLTALRDKLTRLIHEIEPKADYPITQDPRD